MLILERFSPFSAWTEALLDAALLLVLTFPAIYYLAFQPLKKKIIQQEMAENQLFAINAQLREHEKSLEVKNFELKCANLALKESSDRFAQLFDFAPVGYLVLDEVGIVKDINLTGLSLLGVDKENLVNRNFQTILSPEESEHWQLYFNQILTHNEKQTCKLIMQRNNGTVFYALLDCRRDDSLISSNIRVSFNDITKQNWTSFQ